MYRDILASDDNSSILFLSRYIPSIINIQVLSADTGGIRVGGAYRILDSHIYNIIVLISPAGSFICFLI